MNDHFRKKGTAAAVAGVLVTAMFASGQTTYDLARDYFRTSNPPGVWSYGWASELSGPVHLLTFYEVDRPLPSGQRAEYWAVSQGEPPAIYHNPTPETMVVEEGQGVYPPGSVWFYAGFEGSPYTFGVIRFTIPPGGGGVYRLATIVRALYHGPISGDTDFHVVHNGVELFGQFLNPSSDTGYTNRLNLEPGDTVDFMVGRGRDNILYSSGLTIEATLTQDGRYDVSRDFSLASNPNGVWGYGWASRLDGSFNPIHFTKTIASDNGVPIAVWQLSPTELPSIAKVLGPGTAVSAGGQFVAPPGTVYFTPGLDGALQGYAVIRFTVPAGQAGDYRIETAVRPVFDGSIAGDTDFHVIRNGVELFGEFLAAHAGAGYSNVVALAAGDTIDFIVGRGQDGQQSGSALKIQATLTAVVITTPVISINDIIVSEGDKGKQTAVFTVSLSQPAATRVTVDFETVDGTASARDDYEATHGTLRFAPGEKAKTISVTLTADKPPEPDEEFYVQLSHAVGAEIGRDRGTCVITEVRITEIRIDVAVSFNTVAGHFYAVEKSDDMKHWTVVEGAERVAGTGGIVTVSDIGAGCKGRGMYRARLLTD
jgi:hypothetical protein